MKSQYQTIRPVTAIAPHGRKYAWSGLEPRLGARRPWIDSPSRSEDRTVRVRADFLPVYIAHLRIILQRRIGDECHDVAERG